MKQSSYQSLFNSLRYDFQTRQWFVYLIFYLGRLGKRKKDRHSLERLSRSRGPSLFAEILLVATFLWLWFVDVSIAAVCLAPAVLVAFICIRARVILTIQELGGKILQDEFNEKDFEDLTLFQVCEKISRKYSLCSLVESVAFSDLWMVRILVFILVVAPFFHWRFIPAFIAGYFYAFRILNSVTVLNMISKKKKR
jgi:hypothetical protein